MASTVDTLLESICPQLANALDKDIYLEIAQLTTSSVALGEAYNLALALRAAHEYTLDQTRQMGTGGQIIGMTEGRSSVMFAEPSKRLSPLETTQYGQRLKILFRSLGLVATSTGG